MNDAPTANQATPEPLLSGHWHRVSALRPRLRPQVMLRRELQRGVPWFVLLDTSTQEVRRLNAAAFSFVGRCDGTRTVGQIWETLLQAAPDHVIGQPELLRLLIALHQRQLLEFDQTPDIESVFRGRERIVSRRRWEMVNPLAFRVPLLDPSPWLRRLQRPADLLFSRFGLAVWLVLVLVALLLATPQAATLGHDALRLAANPSGWLAAWLIYPVVKMLHELAHGLAMLRWGVMPRKAGVAVFLLVPVPYVDASGADALRLRHQRATISAAGIMAEMAVAAIALLLWLAIEPGWLRDLALTTVLIGAVSTLAVNGNPLLRFDGYFVATDLLDLRNLATRSGRWWHTQLRRHLLGDARTPPFETLPGEAPWLVAYAPASTAYRAVLTVVIATWAGGHSTVLGVVLALGLGGLLIGPPLWRGVQSLRGQPHWRALPRLGAAAAVLALLLCVPLPHRLVVQGVVMPADDAFVRAEVEGELAAWRLADGATVAAGAVVARLEDDPLASRHAAALAAVTEMDVKAYAAVFEQPEQAVRLKEQLALHQARLDELARQLAARDVTVRTAGRLVLPNPHESLGRHVRRGDVLGYVLGAQPLRVKAVVPHGHAGLLAGADREVALRLSSEPGRVIASRIEGQQGAAIARLPSAALGQAAGGAIATDPADADGLRSREPFVLLDIALPPAQATRVGERVHVRLDVGQRSLAARALWALRQLLLSRFNPHA